MANSNNVITAPVRLVEDVKYVLQSNSNDLATLWLDSGIKFWSRVRPCRCVWGTSDIDKITMKLNTGLSPSNTIVLNSLADPFLITGGNSNTYTKDTGVNDNGDLHTKNGLTIKAVTQFNINDSLPFEYGASVNNSNPDVYRLTDFDGYRHDSTPRMPITQKLASDGLLVYENATTSFIFTINPDVENISIPLSCLRKNPEINEFYLSFAFVQYNTGVYARNRFCISTGLKLKELFPDTQISTTKQTNSSSVISQGDSGIARVQSISLKTGIYFFCNLYDVFNNLGYLSVMKQNNWYVRACFSNDNWMNTTGMYIKNYPTSTNSNYYSLGIAGTLGRVSRTVLTENPYYYVGVFTNSSISGISSLSFSPDINSNRGYQHYIKIKKTDINRTFYYLRFSCSRTPLGCNVEFTFSGTISKIKKMRRIDDTFVEYVTSANIEPVTDFQIDSSSKIPKINGVGYGFLFSNDSYGEGNEINYMDFDGQPVDVRTTHPANQVDDITDLRKFFRKNIEIVDSDPESVSEGNRISEKGYLTCKYKYVYIPVDNFQGHTPSNHNANSLQIVFYDDLTNTTYTMYNSTGNLDPNIPTSIS